MSTTIKISEHFHIHEFVPKGIFDYFGTNSRWFIRPEIIELAEFYRSWFEAPVTINNWFWGGSYGNRGYRTPESTIGAKWSQHKMGCAFDASIKGLTADDVRREILENEAEFMAAGLTTLEHADYAPTWVHSDIRSTGLDKILIIKPAMRLQDMYMDVDPAEYFVSENGLLMPVNLLDFFEN